MGVMDTIRLRLLDWLAGDRQFMLIDDEESKTQAFIIVARRYYDGDHEVKLTERQKLWLDQHSGTGLKFTVNHCPAVVDAVVEKLKITGFELSADGEESEELGDVVATWIERVRMAAVFTEGHRKAVRDGEAFVLTDWDEDRNLPRWRLHPRYVDPTVNGDGYGMWIDYVNDDPLNEPIRANKRWKERTPEGDVRRRLTRYYPDRIERYAKEKDNDEWEQFKRQIVAYTIDEETGEEVPEFVDEPWPVPWVDGEGEPLGIPVAHLKNPGLKSELRDVIPLQDALNKTWVDVMAASDTTAFRMLVILGWIPTTDGKEPASDGSNLLEVLPGQMLATTKSKDKVQVDTIDPADLSGLLDMEDRIVMRIATVSDTPLTRFVTSKQIPSDETIKEQEGPLIAKVEERQTLFGDGWEDAVRMALKLAAVFGDVEDIQDAPDDLEIRTNWEPAERVDELEQVQIAQAKKKLGFTTRKVLKDVLGLTDREIEEMESDPEWQARLARMELATVELTNMQNDQPAGGEDDD